MRKYFLLSTVALATMVASEARALGDYLELSVNATIREATTTTTVTPLDFGEIIIDPAKMTGNITITVTNTGTTHTGDGVLAVLGAECAMLDGTSGTHPLDRDYNLPETMELSGSEGNPAKLTLTDLNLVGNPSTGYCIGGTLNISPTNAGFSDRYTGSFTFQKIY